MGAHLRIAGASALAVAISLASSCGGSGGTGGGGKNPPPTITLIGASPFDVTLGGANWVVAGVPGFTLLTGGTGYTSTSVVEWNGTPLPSQFGSSTSLNATVSAALVAAPGTAAISIYDPATGAKSGSVPFGIASPAAATAGVVQMITVAPDGTPANQESLVAPSISATGRYVSFQSAATNLGAGASSAYQQIYERDTCIGAPTGCVPSTIPISVTFDGSPVTGHSRTSSISSDGRYVAFDSSATNILPNSGTCYSLYSCSYLKDTCIGASAGCTPNTQLLSVSSDGETAAGGGTAISTDGRYVTFASNSASLVDNNSGGLSQVFLRDTCSGTAAACAPSTTLKSQSTTGAVGNQNSHPQAVDTGGRLVAFQSYSTNLIPNDTQTASDIFLRDTCIGAAASCTPSTTREDVSNSGAQSNGTLDGEVVPSISSDGRLISYASNSTNLVTQNVNGFGNIYLRDTCFGGPAGCSPTTSLISLGNDNSVPNQGSNNQSMSADGRFIAFASLASNLVPGDTFAAGSWKDIFVRDTCLGAPSGCTPSTVRVSVSLTPSIATEANATSDFPQISGDGHYLVFMSSSTNLLASGGNGYTMIYLARTGY